jgi:hypothetical protein
MTRFPVVLLLCCLALSAFAEPLVMPPLTDQYGLDYSFVPVSGEAVLVIVADARKLRWIGRWEQKLRKSMPELNSYRVAGVLDTPTPAYDDVAAVLQRWVPPEVPIAIDLNNNWAKQYQLDIKEPCLLLLNGQQNIVAEWRGRPKKALIEEVLAALQPYFPSVTSTEAAQ